MFSLSWETIIQYVLNKRRRGILDLIEFHKKIYFSDCLSSNYDEFSNLNVSIKDYLHKNGAELEHIELYYDKPFFDFYYIRAENLYTWVLFHDYYPAYDDIKDKRSYKTSIGTFSLNRFDSVNGDLMSKLNLLTFDESGIVL